MVETWFEVTETGTKVPTHLNDCTIVSTFGCEADIENKGNAVRTCADHPNALILCSAARSGTVANLTRDGFRQLTGLKQKANRTSSAKLNTRGLCYARTLATQAAKP
jgi:hypothetical protein